MKHKIKYSFNIKNKKNKIIIILVMVVNFIIKQYIQIYIYNYVYSCIIKYKNIIMKFNYTY